MIGVAEAEPTPPPQEDDGHPDDPQATTALAVTTTTTASQVVINEVVSDDETPEDVNDDTSSESSDDATQLVPRTMGDLAASLESRGILRSTPVKEAFRRIDRGDYVPPRCRECAYDDAPLRGRDDQLGCVVHLSAPSIYGAVLEALRLSPGDAFLNIGSGSGYLSALAATILTPRSVHHCVERCPVLAQRCRDAFASSQTTRNVKVHAASVFDLDPDNSIAFDKIYCGAGARAEDAFFLAHLLKPNGAIVGPFEGTWVDPLHDLIPVNLNEDPPIFEEWRPRIRRHRPQCLIRATFHRPRLFTGQDDDDDDVTEGGGGGGQEEEEDSDDDDDDDDDEEDDDEDDAGEEGEQEDDRGGLRVREIMPVQFTPLRRDAETRSLSLRGPAWGADAPELFPVAFKLVVSILARAAADPQTSLPLMPWHVWEAGVLSYLAYDDVRSVTNDDKDSVMVTPHRRSRRVRTAFPHVLVSPEPRTI